MAIYKVVGVGEHKKYFDQDTYKNTIDYITNPQKALCVGGYNISSPEKAAEEMEATACAFGKNRGKRVRHSVLAFSEGEVESLEQAEGYLQKMLLHYADDYEILYAIHGDTENLHAHVLMNMVAMNTGKKYDGRKKDYYAFKRCMEQTLGCRVHMEK